MTDEVIYYQFRCRRDTRANFLAAASVLLEGEWGVETDTGGMKMGDGATAYASLPYRVVNFFAVAAGTANAITATFSPPPVLYDGLLVAVRAAAANTTSAPTLNANGGGALTIVKNGGQLLAASDIRGAGHVLQLRYQATGTKWELLNPSGAKPVVTLVDGASIATDAALSDSFRVTLGGNRALANPTNLSDGQVLNYRLIQDGTGNRTLSFGSLFKFPGGVAPTVSTLAGAKDFMSCQYDATGATLFCVLNKAFS